MNGKFTGMFELWPLPSDGHWWGKARYEFRLYDADPLTWHCGGLWAQPDRHFESDGGSIPRLVQCIPALQKDRYWRSYGFHDSAYRYGGWYVRMADGAFRFVRLTRAEADEWLYRMIIAEGGTLATARTVWAAVRACGWACWSSKRQAEARFQDGVTASK